MTYRSRCAPLNMCNTFKMTCHSSLINVTEFKILLAYCIERRKESLTSVSPSRDDVGDALSTQKETNYPSHAESPNRHTEERNTRCRVKIQNTDRGTDRHQVSNIYLIIVVVCTVTTLVSIQTPWIHFGKINRKSLYQI